MINRFLRSNLAKALLSSMSLAALISCDSQATKPVSAQVNNTTNKAVVASTDPAAIIARARNKKSPERETLLLNAADFYFKQPNLEKARALLDEINPNTLNDTNFVKHSQLSAQIELKEGRVDAAKRRLNDRKLEQQLNALPPQQEAELRELRAQAFTRNGQLNDAIAERITLSSMLPSTQTSNDNQNALWQALMRLPLSELQQRASQGSGGITQGWYSLAALSKNSQLDISAQQAALDVWKKKWESHPAANNLPKDLFALQTAATHQPQKLALLLPMQGRLSEAGDAVRDGFFAAYYQQNPATQSLPSVRFYDTTKGAVNAYQTAVSDGAELIIGPLDKDDVNQISKLPNLTVPLLSLNYPDQAPAQALNNFYQFGLAVEDEARQTARYAIQQGYTRALVIAAPQDVSERSTQAFVNEWQKLGGIVVSKATFTTPDSFSQSIKELMLADQSQARATLLQQQLGTKMEFTPRARTDIDMIFMAVSPSQGRQIKPIFAFHNANNIPSFATSSIYSGDADANNNDDLNDIIFSTLPWLFETNIQKQTLSKNSKSANIYGRLQALGIDAFHLYSRLAQLQQSPEIQIYGATGALHLLTNGRIEREQIWAHFNNGIAEPLSASAKATNMQTTQP